MVRAQLAVHVLLVIAHESLSHAIHESAITALIGQPLMSGVVLDIEVFAVFFNRETRG